MSESTSVAVILNTGVSKVPVALFMGTSCEGASGAEFDADVVTLELALYDPSPEEFVARSRYQYVAPAVRPESLIVELVVVVICENVVPFALLSTL